MRTLTEILVTLGVIIFVVSAGIASAMQGNPIAPVGAAVGFFLVAGGVIYEMIKVKPAS